MQSRFLGILALASLATPAAALDFGNGFSVVGDVELSYLSSGGSSTSTFGFEDVTLGWRSQAGGAIGYGFDLNFVGVQDLDQGDPLSTIWGGLVLTTAAGEFTIGNPRPLLKTLFDTPYIGGDRIFDLEFGSLIGSSVEYFALLSDEGLYGVSFKGGTGALTYGASYHKFDTEDASAYELVAGYQAGKTQIQGGVEVLDVTAFTIRKFLLGATYVSDRWSAGAQLSHSTQPMGDLTGFEVFGDYAVSDSFKLGAQVLRLEGLGSPVTFYGVTGEYGFGSGGFARLGVLDTSQGSDTSYSASVGYRF